jgi:hypothetical protein
MMGGVGHIACTGNVINVLVGKREIRTGIIGVVLCIILKQILKL